MPTYIQLLTLTQEGRERTLHDPEVILHAQHGIVVPGVRVLGRYAVLGKYDFVVIVEAQDNESVARFSVALGALAEAHIVTLPVIPIARLEAPADPDEHRKLETAAEATPPAELRPRDRRGRPRQT